MENNTAENRLKKTFFVVEATSFECFTLWRNHSSDSPYNESNLAVEWEQMDRWLVTVGNIGKRPCTVSMTLCKIDGELVMFYEQTSQVSDSIKTEKWIKKHFKGTYENGRRAWTDASNFNHCLMAIKNKKENLTF